MNENKVLKQSVYIFIIGFMIFAIFGLFISDISYVIGFVIGYLISLVVFQLIMRMSTEILSMKSASILIVLGFMFKLLLYALGFFLAVKLDFVHIVGVFFGYLVIKITIYIGEYMYKGGDDCG